MLRIDFSPPLPHSARPDYAERSPSLPHSAHPDFAEQRLSDFFIPRRERRVLIYERERAKASIRDIRLLGPNWDGYNAEPVLKAGANAQRLFEILENSTPGLINPDITPTSAGTVAMELESVEGEAYIEIGNTKYSCFIRRRSGESQFYEGNAETIQSSLLGLVQQSLFPVSDENLTINSFSIAA
jgi:hypothetical protein